MTVDRPQASTSGASSSTNFAVSPGANEPAAPMRPAANSSRPATRYVRVQTVSLDSAHGVLNPQYQFMRKRGMTLPR